MKYFIPFLFLSVMLFACSDSLIDEGSSEKTTINDESLTKQNVWYSDLKIDNDQTASDVYVPEWAKSETRLTEHSYQDLSCSHVFTNSLVRVFNYESPYSPGRYLEIGLEQFEWSSSDKIRLVRHQQESNVVHALGFQVVNIEPIDEVYSYYTIKNWRLGCSGDGINYHWGSDLEPPEEDNYPPTTIVVKERNDWMENINFLWLYFDRVGEGLSDTPN